MPHRRAAVGVHLVDAASHAVVGAVELPAAKLAQREADAQQAGRGCSEFVHPPLSPPAPRSVVGNAFGVEALLGLKTNAGNAAATDGGGGGGDGGGGRLRSRGGGAGHDGDLSGDNRAGTCRRHAGGAESVAEQRPYGLFTQQLTNNAKSGSSSNNGVANGGGGIKKRWYWCWQRECKRWH